MLNAQPLDGQLFTGMNYVRNSVKVTIDAYDGSVHLYIVDDQDPIIAAWARIFPELFSPMSAMSPDLRAHLRYPEDLFTAQNEQYQLYHVPGNAAGAETLYTKQDRWALASQQTDVGGQAQVIEPYYVIMKLPGEQDAEFVLIQPMVTAGRNNMIAWVAARMDPGHYGERIAFRFPSDTSTFGPAQNPVADQPGQHRVGAVHAVVAGRLVSGARQPAGAADGRLAALHGADLPAVHRHQPA